MYVACTQEREQIVSWRILFLIKQVMYAAFSPINENVFTTEAWILLGPSVHKLYGWLPLITVLLETCAWSGLTVACLVLERAPMCFAWIVGNQQGFRLPGKFNCGKPVEGKGGANAHWGMGCFLYASQRKGKEICVGEGGAKESSQASCLQHRAWVQTHPGRYLRISLNDAISVDSHCDDFYFVLFIQITPAA